MIDQIRDKFQRGLVEYSLHAVRRMMARGIATAEVLECIMAGEVIEDYPEDKYGPSCLIFGRTSKRALHVQCTYPSRPLIKVITAYEPDSAEWLENLKERRK
jgi:hypothetical protein